MHLTELQNNNLLKAAFFFFWFAWSSYVGSLKYCVYKKSNMSITKDIVNARKNRNLPSLENKSSLCIDGNESLVENNKKKTSLQTFFMEIRRSGKANLFWFFFQNQLPWIFMEISRTNSSALWDLQLFKDLFRFHMWLINFKTKCNVSVPSGYFKNPFWVVVAFIAFLLETLLWDFYKVLPHLFFYTQVCLAGIKLYLIFKS